jgi:hypothetical protein
MIAEKLKWKRVVPLNNSKPERDETGEWYDHAWENEQGGEILPRSEHATVVMGKKIIIIGGMGAHFVRDDICIIDTGTTHTHSPLLATSPATLNLPN